MGSKFSAEIAGAVALGGILGVLEFGALDVIARVRKCGHKFAIDDSRVPSAMIEMQVRVDDDIDFLGPDATGGELIRQARRAFEGVDVAALGVPFIACAGFDQDPLPCRANQQRIHRAGECDCDRRRATALPHGFRNDAEHRAAIEAERAVGENVKFEVAEFHECGIRTFHFGAACKQFVDCAVGIGFSRGHLLRQDV